MDSIDLTEPSEESTQTKRSPILTGYRSEGDSRRRSMVSKRRGGIHFKLLPLRYRLVITWIVFLVSLNLLSMILNTFLRTIKDWDDDHNPDTPD